MSAEPIRRFYTNVRVADDGAGVMLDERRLRTAGGNAFATPTRALAVAIAEEWNAQGEHIMPTSMPLTQLAFASIDATPRRRDELVSFVAKYGETDLVCHRAETPPTLVERQTAVWDPLVAWAARDLGALLPVVFGILPAPTNLEAIETLRAHAATSDDFHLTALAHAADLAGSAVIAFALLHGRLDPAHAFAAAMLDDLWGLETWGDDAEARARLERQRREFEALGRYIAALGEA